MAIIALTYIVDVTVEFQFNAMAKLAYTNQRDLAAFLGEFLWSLVEFDNVRPSVLPDGLRGE